MNKLAESRTERFEAANADFRACLAHFGLGFTYLFRSVWNIRRGGKHLVTGVLITFIFIALMPAKGFATTNNTITIDASLADWADDEKLGTSFGQFYFTWDANNFYFAYNKGETFNADPDVVWIYISTVTPTSTAGTFTSVDWSGTHTLPFRAGYVYLFRPNNEYKTYRNWTGSAWSGDWAGTAATSQNYGAGIVEIKIPRTDIGSPSNIRVTLYITNGSNNYVFGTTPRENPNGATGRIMGLSWYYPSAGASGVFPNLMRYRYPGVVIADICHDAGAAANEYVQLYNPNDEPIYLSNLQSHHGLSPGIVFYLMRWNASTAQTVNIATVVSTNTVRSRGFSLIGAGTLPISADITGTSNMAFDGSNDAAVISYSNQSTAANRADPTLSTNVDKVGWGAPSANGIETTAISVFASDNSIQRKAWSTTTSSAAMVVGGADEYAAHFTDTHDNSNDFVTIVGSWTPRNSTSPREGFLGNCWHIPDNTDDLGVSMRDPVTGIQLNTPTTFYAGNQFQGAGNPGDMSGGKVYYKSITETNWQESALSYYSTSGNNKFWKTIITNSYAAGTTVQYYIDVNYADSHDTTNLYWTNSLARRSYEIFISSNNPYSFVVAAGGAGNTAPNDPLGLNQWDASTTTIISTGSWISNTYNQTGLSLSVKMSDPDSSETLYPIIEYKPIVTAFTGVTLTTGTGVSYSGTAVIGTITVTGLTTNTSYHWRARVYDGDDVSGWISFPYNVGQAETESDFGCDTSSPTNVGCSKPADGAYNLNTSTSLTALTAADGGSGVDQYSFEVSTASSFDKPGDIDSGWTTSPYSPPGLAQSTTYYWRVKAKDNVGNESPWRGEADTAGYRKFITAAKIVDGNPADWGNYSGSQLDNSSLMSGTEWVWKDKEWDERQDVDTATDDHFEFKEWRMWSDDTDLYFLVRFTGDITDTLYPYVAISIDTNTASTGMNWTADDSGVTMGVEYGRAGDTYHYPEHNLIVHHTNSGLAVQIEQYKESAAAWAAPATHGGGANFLSADNDVLEFKIARSDIGLDGSKTARFTFSLYAEAQLAGEWWATDDNTTDSNGINMPPDALDTMSIIRMSDGSNTYNDNYGSMNANDEDINDSDLDFWVELSFDASGIVANNEPTAPNTAVSPANASKIFDTTPEISWSGATDGDADDITSYLLLVDTDTTFYTPHTYKVNVSETGSFTVPSPLAGDKTYYWRVYTRDKQGDLSPVSTTWSFYVKGRTIDGNIGDWGSETPSVVNASTIDTAKNEYVWRDKIGESRTVSADPASNFDIEEIRITANDTYIYFLIKSADITGIDIPHFAISIDTDTSLTDSQLPWIDDDSTATGSMGLGDEYSQKIRAERNIVICSSEAATTRVFLYADDGSSWYVPVSGDWEACASEPNNVFEFKIKRSDICLDNAKTFRFALASADNVIGNPQTIDTTEDYNPDSLDSMSIVRISTGSGTGQYHSDPANDLNAWDEEISDSDIDFWCQLSISADGTLSNNAPDVEASNPSPADNGKYSTDAKPPLSWTPGSDSDSGDYVTSYLLEFATHTDLGSNLGGAGEYGYRVNIGSSTSPSWTIPNDLKNDLTYYWRVFSRDACGTLSASPGVWSVKVDSVAPSAITALSALTGDSGGEVNLSWTATGDNDLSGALPAGSNFRIEYASWTAVVWSTNTATSGAGSYITISTAVSAGTICSRTVDSLTEGVTYYFRIWTADEIPNWSAISNAATAYAYVTPPAPPPDDGAMVVYYSTLSAVANIPQYRTLTEGTTTWSSVASANSVGHLVRYWQVLRNSPRENVKLLATLDHGDDLQTQRWTSSGWGTVQDIDLNVGGHAKRCFDLCYEHNSGDALLVYYDGTDTTPHYQTLAKGQSAWVDHGAVSPYEISGAPTWIRLESRLGSDAILLAAQDVNADLFAMLWDGSGWLQVSSTTLTTSLSHTNQCFDVACEYQSGNFMVVYGTPTVSVKYRRLLSGTTSWEAEGGLADADAAVRWVKLASEKRAGSNYIICGNLDDGNDLDVQVWDGSSWGTSVEVSATVESDAKRSFDVEWEATSEHRGIVVYAQNNSQDLRYGTIDGKTVNDIDGNSLDVDDITSDEPDTVRLCPDPYSDDIWAIYSVGHTASTATICAERWKGIAESSWDGAKKLTTTSYESDPYENFSIAYGTYPAPPAADTTPPCAISNLTAIAGSDDGEVTLTWTAPGDDGAGGNVSGGLYRIKAATYNITSANFGSVANNGYYSFTVDVSTSYNTQGTEHSYGFTGLYPGTTYYFAMKLRDENAANWASWSDTASSSDTAPAQDLAPPAPSNLTVQPGQNKISLTWTEVTGEPDLDYYKIYRDSSTPYNYADAYTITVDTGNSSYLDTGLSNTVTYYYKMTVVDLGDSGNGLFSHARESAFSNEKSTSPLGEMLTPEAFLVYFASSTNQVLRETPQCGSWSGSSWASGYDVKRITQTATGWYVVKKCPTADKWMFGIQDSAKVLNVMIYDETAKEWSAPKKLTTNISYAGSRGFDIEFEQQSGRAVIVYKDANTKIPQAVTWTDTGGWGTAFALSISTNGAGYVAWLELIPKPNSNDMLLMISDSYKDLSAHVWFATSTQTGSSILLDTELETYGQSCFDGAYEMQSGDAMVAWDNDTGQIRYRILSGSSWGAEQPGPQNIGVDIWWVRLVSDPKSDAMILGTLDGATPFDINVSSWNGTNWGTTTEVEASASVSTTRPFDIAWETSSGDGLVVFNDGTSVPKARRLSAGVWDGADTSASDVAAAPCCVQLVSDNNTDDIMLVTCNADATPDIYVQKWDGSSNSFGSAALITDNSSNKNGSAYSHNFAAAYPYVQPTDNTAPAAITTLSASTRTLTGEVALSWEAPGDDSWTGELGASDDVARFAIQYATYTEVSWSKDSADVTIDTYTVTPYDIQSYDFSLNSETTYYFRIWTRDEASAGNWSDISVGATVWCRIAPAAVTALSSLAEDNGDVQLSWIAPGDDGTTGSISDGQWKIRYSTISTVDWTTASSGWTDYDDKYEFLIDTSCAAISEHGKNINGLHGGVTYYFRLWTRDEATGINAPGNWSSISNASTACVVKVLGVSVSTDTYNFGEVDLSASSVTASGITVKNTGNVYQDYSMRVSSVTLFDGSPSVWKATDTAVGYNLFILYGIFHGEKPESNYFVNQDTVTAVDQTSDSERYSYDGSQTGASVPKQEERTLWLKLDMPTAVLTSKQEKIKVTVTAGKSP